MTLIEVIMEKKFSIKHKLMLSYAGILLTVLLLAGLFILPAQSGDLKTQAEKALLEATQILSKDPEIKDSVEKSAFSPELISRMDEIMADSYHNGSIVICDKHRKRLYHPNHDHIGERFDEGDEKKLFEGMDTYVSSGPKRYSSPVRAFHSVKNDKGEMVGFVIATGTLDPVIAMQLSLMQRLSLICLLCLFVGLVLCHAIARNLRRALLGKEDPNYRSMFLQREDILNHLSEGILAFDEDRQVVYKNAAGASFFPQEHLAKESPLYPDYDICLHKEEAITDISVVLNGKNYLANVIPVVREGLFRTVMIILKDRTEVVQLTKQMEGTGRLVDALRSSTHEFMNKLHVISGLLQIGEVPRALSLIGDISEELDQGYQTVVVLMQNRVVAALILGKENRAKELGIHFVLRPDSFLPAETPLLTTSDLVTIIGNLTENAFDAMQGKTQDRHVELFVGCDEKGICICVDDTGCGMSKDLIDRIRHGRYSSKGSGHGYGLWLVQNIVNARGGYLQIDSEQGEGSSFSVIIGAKETKDTGKEP